MTTEPRTPADGLRELLALRAAATPGPWTPLTHGTATQRDAAGQAYEAIMARRLRDSPEIEFTDISWVETTPDGPHIGLTGNGPQAPENAAVIAAAANWLATDGEAALAAMELGAAWADTLLARLSEDDVMYDHPVSSAGEPMDPVLFVRWDAIRAALAAAPPAPLDVERLARALMAYNDPGRHWDDVPRGTQNIWREHAAALLREYAAATEPATEGGRG